MYNLDKIEENFGITVLTPNSPKDNSPMGNAWPVNDALDNELLAQVSEYDEAIAFGYSSGAFFAAGLSLRHPGAFKSVGCMAGGINGRDAWMIPNHASRYIFVHGARDAAPVGVGAQGGSFPVNRNASEWEGYLGWEQALWGLSNARNYSNEERVDFIDPADDGWLMGRLFGQRFAGVDTTRRDYYRHRVYLVDVWGHVDYVGYQAMSILTEDLLTGG